MLMKAIFGFVLVGTLFTRAETIRSALKVGDSIPDVTLRTTEGEGASLRKLLSDKPACLCAGIRVFASHLLSLLGLRFHTTPFSCSSSLLG